MWTILGLQVLTVFFGSFIAGSLLNQIQSIVHNPTSLVHILGDAAPQVAVFFMTYLLLMVSHLTQHKCLAVCCDSIKCMLPVSQGLHVSLTAVLFFVNFLMACLSSAQKRYLAMQALAVLFGQSRVVVLLTEHV